MERTDMIDVTYLEGGQPTETVRQPIIEALYRRHALGRPRAHGCGTPAGYRYCNEDMDTGAGELARQLQADGWDIDAPTLRRFWQEEEQAGAIHTHDAILGAAEGCCPACDNAVPTPVVVD